MHFQARQGDIDSTSPHAYRELTRGINNEIATAPWVKHTACHDHP